MKRIGLLFVVLFLISCDRGELPIAPHDPGDVLTTVIPMESDYRNQLFYDLGSNSVVSSNIKTDWDIALESSIEGYHVFLNSARGGGVWKIDGNHFDSLFVPDLSEDYWRWDSPSGNIDSTAVGDYRGKDIYFVINRGYNASGNHTGYRKMRIDSVNSQGYMMRIASLDNALDTIFWIYKDVSSRRIHLTFSDYETVVIDPDRFAWDLLFSQYTHVFGDTMAYLVTGCLINTENISVAVDTVNLFSEINYDIIGGYVFSNRLNVIGYNWKEYQDGSYVIFPDINYIIKDVEGLYFKLHFIDFYNELGQKGFPTFELQQL